MKEKASAKRVSPIKISTRRSFVLESYEDLKYRKNKVSIQRR